MRNHQLAFRLTASLVLLFMGSGTARADDASTQTAPSAPRISCNISMQHWCIVQADSIVNMVDDGRYRTWSIASGKAERPSVVIRESKLCDSTDEFHPKKIGEADDIRGRQRRRHIVTFALTADKACTVRVAYPKGNDDWAREGERLATYRLYACDGGSCRMPLLSIR